MSTWRPKKCVDCGTACKGTRCLSCHHAHQHTGKQPKAGRCAECGARCRAKGGVCANCLGRDLSAGELTGGRWTAVGGVQRYVKWTDDECAERADRARRLFRQQRVQALLAERYADQTWWKRPGVIPATPQTGSQRLDEIAADFDAHDARFRPTREVA